MHKPINHTESFLNETGRLLKRAYLCPKGLKDRIRNHFWRHGIAYFDMYELSYREEKLGPLAALDSKQGLNVLEISIFDDDWLRITSY